MPPNLRAEDLSPSYRHVCVTFKTHSVSSLFTAQVQATVVALPDNCGDSRPVSVLLRGPLQAVFSGSPGLFLPQGLCRCSPLLLEVSSSISPLISLSGYIQVCAQQFLVQRGLWKQMLLAAPCQMRPPPPPRHALSLTQLCFHAPL